MFVNWLLKIVSPIRKISDWEIDPCLPEGKSLQLVDKGKQNLQIPLLSSQGSLEKGIICNSLILGEEKEIILVIKYSDG